MHEKLNWMCVGFPEWTAQFSVWKTTGKDSSEACAIACQNCAVYSVFPSGVTSHSKIAQFKWECIAPFRLVKKWVLVGFYVPVLCVCRKYLCFNHFTPGAAASNDALPPAKCLHQAVMQKSGSSTVALKSNLSVLNQVLITGAFCWNNCLVCREALQTIQHTCQQNASTTSVQQTFRQGRSQYREELFGQTVPPQS
jgi:hypothetical protein